jgi:hypothetical protein
MFKWIASKINKETSDHPLGTDAAISEFLAHLTPGRPETNLLELVEWLDDPRRLSAALPAERVLRAITRLDEEGQKALALCWTAFLAEIRVDHLGEQKLKTLDTYYQAIIVAYRHCLQLLAAEPTLVAANQLGPLTGNFAQRVLAAAAGRQRIMHIRYRTPDDEWWETVGATLQSARAANVINLKQRSYPEDPVPSSPWVEFLIALLFETSPLGNIVPQQMDLLYRLLRWLETHFTVQNSFSSQSTYFVRLDRPATPVRTTAAQPADPNIVYFGPGLAYGQLVRLRSILKQSGELPDWMKASCCSHEKSLAVIDALIMHWSERPPERRFARASKEAPIRVTHSFSQIRRLVAFAEFARSGRNIGYKTHLEMLKFERFGFADNTNATETDEERWQNATPMETLQLLETSGDRQMMDEWSMKDISATGLGALVPFLTPWIAIGAYVGYRLADEIDWRIGIIRRIHRVKTGHPSVGVETLPEIPRCAQIMPMRVLPGTDPWQQLGREDTSSGVHDAIVLSMSESQLLIPPGLFDENAVIALIVAGKRAPARLLSLVHRNADCDCVQYELLDRVE